MTPSRGTRDHPACARHRGDRAGDPLDGLVNLFDLGIVLAVAFLLAALQSVNLDDLLTKSNVTLLRTEANSQTLIVKQGDSIKTVTLSKKTVTGSGRPVGQVYRLKDGRLVYVKKGEPPAARCPRGRRAASRRPAAPSHSSSRPRCAAADRRSPG